MKPEERVRISPSAGWTEVFTRNAWRTASNRENIRSCIAEAVAEAVREERERCARIADREGVEWGKKNADRCLQSHLIAGLIRSSDDQVKGD